MDKTKPTHGEWLYKSRNIQQYLSRLAHPYRVAALELGRVHCSSLCITNSILSRENGI